MAGTITFYTILYHRYCWAEFRSGKPLKILMLVPALSIWPLPMPSPSISLLLVRAMYVQHSLPPVWVGLGNKNESCHQKKKNIISKTNKILYGRKQSKRNPDSGSSSHGKDGRGGFFIYGKKISCHRWRPCLKDIADEKFAASTISQDGDGEILLSNLASHGSLSQLDNLQIKNNISAE